MLQSSPTSRISLRIRRIARGVPSAQQGQSLAELSVVLPVLLLFLLGATNLGLALQAHMRLAQEVQQAVQLLSYNHESSNTCSVTSSDISNATSGFTKTAGPYNSGCYQLDVAAYLYMHGFTDITSATISVTTSSDTVCQSVSGTAVKSQVTMIYVSVDYPYTLVIPAFGGFNVGALRNGQLHLGATASTVAASTAGPTVFTTGSCSS